MIKNLEKKLEKGRGKEGRRKGRGRRKERERGKAGRRKHLPKQWLRYQKTFFAEVYMIC